MKLQDTSPSKHSRPLVVAGVLVGTYSHTLRRTPKAVRRLVAKRARAARKANR